MTAPTAPTHPDIEAARRAWLATCHALARHIDPEAEPAPCAACQVYEGCEARAALADDEERAFQELERTKGGRKADGMTTAERLEMGNATFEAIAEHVHKGWAAEKRRQAFADHPWPPAWRDGVHHSTQHGGPCAIAYSHHHPDMLPYAELAENVKEYDRATVRAVLDGIAAAGLRVVPAAEAIS